MKQKYLLVSFGLLGFTALIFQVVFAKKLMLIFGLTAPAVATVLAVYFSGLAIGSLVFGRIIDRLAADKARLLYSAIFAAVGIYGLLTPFLFLLLSKLLYVVNQVHVLSFSGFNFFAFLFSFLFLVIPSIFIGGAFPVVSKMFIREEVTFGRKISKLYFVEIIGSALGAAMAGFVFLSALGNNATTILASALNIFLAIYLFKYCELQKESLGGSVANTSASSAPTTTNKIFIPVLFVTGFLALALEVVYTKTLILFVGSSTYAFSLILVIFLLGLALGSLAASFFIDRIKQANAYLGIFFGLLGFWLFLTIYFFQWLPFLFLQILSLFETVNFSVTFFGNLVLIFLVIFPATFLMGIIFPFCLKLYNPSLNKFGQGIGVLYSINTFGGVLGSLVAGFVLLPYAGFQKTLLIILTTYCLLGVVFILQEKKIDLLIKGLLVVFLGVWVVLAFFRPIWSKKIMSSGVFIYAKQYLLFGIKGTKNGLASDEVLFYKEGLSQVVVIKRGETTLLRVNGKTDASNGKEDLETEILLGALPMILHPNPKDVLVVGLGAGITLGTVTQFAEAKSIEVAEIDPAVVQATAYFKNDNHDVLNNSRVKVIAADGRNHLSLNDKKYDVISSEPSNLWVSGNQYLFTKEFYELAKSRLKDDGVILHWIHTYNLKAEDLQVVIKTFQEVFPQTYLFGALNDADLFLVGSPNKDFALDYNLVKKYFLNSNVKDELARVSIYNQDELLAYLIAGPKLLREFTERSSIQTDNRMFLEYSSSRTLFEDTVSHSVSNLKFLRKNTKPLDLIVGGNQEELAKHFAFREKLIPVKAALYLGDLEGALDLYREATVTGLQNELIVSGIYRLLIFTGEELREAGKTAEVEALYKKAEFIFN